MEIKLNLLERLAICNSFPQSASLSEMRAIRNLKKTLEVSESEKKECDFMLQENSYTCNVKAKNLKLFQITDIELNVLNEIVLLWDENKQVNELNFDLCERIQELYNKLNFKDNG